MDFQSVTDPLDVIDGWRRDAEQAGATLPERMSLATVGLDGAPRARVVLWKGRSGRGLWFFTNYESDKARELEREPRATLLFHFPERERQARVRGSVERLPEADSERYFATRPRLSQLGAWASRQSRVLSSRGELERAVDEMEQRFAGSAVPRPANWGGFALVASEVELWSGSSGRLHDRARFWFESRASGESAENSESEGVWRHELLWP